MLLFAICFAHSLALNAILVTQTVAPNVCIARWTDNKKLVR